MNSFGYEKFNNNNNSTKPVLLRVPKGLILIVNQEKAQHNQDPLNKMFIENKDETCESNCKMLHEAVYNKFYDIMVANKRKPSVTHKNKKKNPQL